MEMLGLLDRHEAARFGRMLASPYFPVHPALPLLCDFLLDAQGAADKQAAWEAVHPGMPYDDLALRRYMSELLGLLAEFLRLESAEAGMQPQLHLLRQLRQREAAGLYDFYFRKLERAQSAGRLPLNSGALLDAYLLQAERNAWLERSANRSGVTNLDASVESLDRFYLFNKLKYACTRLNNSNVVSGEFQDPFLEGLLRQLPESHYADDPAILIYVRIYQMLSRPDEGHHYPDLRQMLALHAPAFTRDEARHLYAFVLNYCIGRINAGEGRFLHEIFGLYREAIDRQVLLEAGGLSPWDFKNIVVVGLRLSEFDWVERFIHGYKDSIPAEHRDNAFTYNLAKLHFYRRDYSKVLQLLLRLEYEDVFYNLDAKTMLLKIYYEQREIEALDSLLDSFRTFLRRNRLISEHHRTNYLNLIRFVKKLSRVRHGDAKRLAQVRADVEATRQIADRDWLVEKMG